MDLPEKAQRPKDQSYFRFLWPSLVYFVSCTDGWLWAADFVLTDRETEREREGQRARERTDYDSNWRRNNPWKWGHIDPDLPLSGRVSNIFSVFLTRCAFMWNGPVFPSFPSSFSLLFCTFQTPGPHSIPRSISKVSCRMGGLPRGFPFICSLPVSFPRLREMGGLLKIKTARMLSGGIWIDG